MQICLATTEILGAHRNGGIGTATSHLAVLMADAGHDVTLLYDGGEPVEIGSLWHGIYHRFNIKTARLRSGERPLEPSVLRQTVTFFEYLRGASFDMVIFQDCMGLAQACVLAKRAGIAFAGCHLSIIAHGNIEWVLDAAGRLPESRDQLLYIETERQAVEFADSLVSPSTYLLDWMRQHDWRLPAQTLVIQNFLQGLRLAGVERPMARQKCPLKRHLVFFGRLEERKGIYLFLEALREPALSGQRFELSFLGKEFELGQEQLIAWLTEHRPDLLPLVSFHKDRDVNQALDYLKTSGGIAVIPSLADNSPCVVWECIEHAIPFIATKTGGIPELVADDVHDEILVPPQPEPLAARLRTMLDVAAWPDVKHKQNQVQVGRNWLEFLGTVSTGSAAALTSRSSRNDERITVVLLDLADEAALRARLGELCLQTSHKFDTIIVSHKSRVVGGPIAEELKASWVIRDSSSWSAALVAGARAATTELLVVTHCASVLPSNLVEALRLSLAAFPNVIVTGQSIGPIPAALRGEQAFFTGDLPRQGFLGGPLCLGPVENCFGGFPFGIRRDVLLASLGADSAVADVWPLLAKCALTGHRILSLPIPLAAEPQIQNTSPMGGVPDMVRRLYQSQLPRELRKLVHLGRL